MIDWSARIDELAFHLATQYRMEDRQALEILLSALIPCPRTAEPWLVAETNWYSRDCAPAWFSFGEAWLPESLPLLRAMRPRNANQRIAAWLAEPPAPRLFVEADYDRRLPHYRRIHEISFLLARTLRLRVISTLDGVTRPADERDQQTRTDRLRALTADVLQDRAGARPSDPSSWNEPRNFLYCTELAVRLAGRHSDYGQIASALRALAIRRAFLYGRSETDPSDISLLERALQDYVPPWVHRAVEHLSSAPKHHAETRSLASAMRLEPTPYPECARLYRMGIFTLNRAAESWGLVPDHAPGVLSLIAGRAFQPMEAAAAR
jgi:hypothetical protein